MALNNFNTNHNTADPNDPNNIGATAGPCAWDNDPFAAMSINPLDFLINYNDKFQNDMPTLFRDAVIQQTLSCLIGKFKPNALLVGPAGVGKTKIVEDIARRIATDDPLIPDQLKDHIIYELPLSNIVAGSGIVGDVEKKTKAILDFAQDPANKVILFIDEVHMLINGNPTYDKIAQLMKPALARGDMKVIAATTVQESQNLMDDPAFNRRFTRLIVDELSPDQTKHILEQMKLSMFDHYCKRVAITDKLIEEVIMVADEFKTVGSHRPDNAITLLDRAMADAYIQRKILETNAKNDPQLLAALQATPTIVLSKSQLRRTAMKLMTGNNEKTETNVASLKDKLSVIKGQDQIIDHLLDIIERDSLNIYPRTKPLTLLFAGNSGVGKSEIAKIIANEITGVKPIILNMTEYHSSASINRIIGAPAGYIGSDSKNELPFDILESNPYQVILLDEFEKSNRSVQRLFMSAFDEGYIKTSRGKIVDFSRTIIIATTNAGHTDRADPIGFTTDENNESTATISDLSSAFDIELLNRFSKVFNFNAITESLFAEIVADVYTRQVAVIKANHTSYTFLADTIPADALSQLVKDNYAKEFGARPAQKAVRKYIEDMIIAHKNAKPTAAVIADGNNAE